MQRMVTYPELKSLFGIPFSPQHILRLQKAGKFPLRRKLGNFNFWTWEEIDAWVRSLRKPTLQAPEDRE